MPTKLPKHLKDPTGGPQFRRSLQYHDASDMGMYQNRWDPGDLQAIDDAYNIDTIIRQGVRKHLELNIKHGWKLKCQTAEPRQYLEMRIKMIAHQTATPWAKHIHRTVNDLLKYGRALWIKVRGQAIDVDGNPIPGMPIKGAYGAPWPVLGYFRVDPKQMSLDIDPKTKIQKGWQYRHPNGSILKVPLANVVYFEYTIQPGETFPTPDLAPVIEDVANYRTCEEYVMKLLFRHLNPLVHHEVPDRTGSGLSLQDDVDDAYASHTALAPDGLIVTPHGHTIKMIGAESQALRAEGYLQMLRHRAYLGLGVNDVVMGEGISTAAHADAMTTAMHNAAKFLQKELGAMLTAWVLDELLLEGGYNVLDDRDIVTWEWNEIELEAQIKLQNHVQQMYTNNLITIDRARHLIGEDPLTPEEESRLYVYVAKIPEIQALEEAKSRADASDGPAKQSASRNNPSNQHGPRGAPKLRGKG